MDLRTANVTRYILPLREGGSLPALAEADDEFKYVVKFRGAGHGTKALIAELIGGEIARTLGFRVPEIIFLNLDEAFGRTEADEEIQDLLQASRGLNLGLHFLSGAFTFDSLADNVNSELASKIVWIDALLTNIDRTVKNTNMLMWHKELWLIDFGSSLYFHYMAVYLDLISIQNMLCSYDWRSSYQQTPLRLLTPLRETLAFELFHSSHFQVLTRRYSE